MSLVTNHISLYPNNKQFTSNSTFARLPSFFVRVRIALSYNTTQITWTNLFCLCTSWEWALNYNISHVAHLVLKVGSALTWTLVFSLWKEFTPTWNQNTSRIPLQSLPCFASFSIVYWKICFWVCFCPSYDAVSSHLVKNSMDRVSVICKLAMKWYPMRMRDSWLCPFNDWMNIFDERKTLLLQKHCLFHITIGVYRSFLLMQVAGKKPWWITKQPCSSTPITQWLWWTWVGICVQQEIFRKQSKLTRGLYWDTETLCATTGVPNSRFEEFIKH